MCAKLKQCFFLTTPWRVAYRSLFSWSVFHEVLAEMAIWVVKQKWALLPPSQTGRVRDALPPARWLRRAATAEANGCACVTIAEWALAFFWDQDQLFKPLPSCFSWTDSSWSRANGWLVEVSSAVGAEPASNWERGVSSLLAGFVLIQWLPPPPLRHGPGAFPFCAERPVQPSALRDRFWSRFLPSALEGCRTAVPSVRLRCSRPRQKGWRWAGSCSLLPSYPSATPPHASPGSSGVWEGWCPGEERCMDKGHWGTFFWRGVGAAGSGVGECAVLQSSVWAGDPQLEDAVVCFISRAAFGLFILTAEDPLPRKIFWGKRPVTRKSR